MAIADNSAWAQKGDSVPGRISRPVGAEAPHAVATSSLEVAVSVTNVTFDVGRGRVIGAALSRESVTIPEGYEVCRRVAREVARTFYYGSLFLPAPQRKAAWALYAFCRTADDMADEPDLFPDPLESLARWREDLRETYAGRPIGPVMVAWADLLGRYKVPIEPALDLLDGVEMDVRGASYETFDDLYTYCYRVAGTVGLLMTPVLGYEREEALACAVDLGVAMQLTNILRDVGEDAAHGRVYLPVEDLARFNYTQGDLFAGILDARFRRLMEFEMARAEAFYERGMRGVKMLAPEGQLAIALSGALYRQILHRVRRNRYDVFTRRAHVPLVGKLAAVPVAWLRLCLAHA